MSAAAALEGVRAPTPQNSRRLSIFPFFLCVLHFHSPQLGLASSTTCAGGGVSEPNALGSITSGHSLQEQDQDYGSFIQSAGKPAIQVGKRAGHRSARAALAEKVTHGRDDQRETNLVPPISESSSVSMGSAGSDSQVGAIANGKTAQNVSLIRADLGGASMDGELSNRIAEADTLGVSSLAVAIGSPHSLDAQGFHQTQGGLLSEINAMGNASQREVAMPVSLGEAHGNLTMDIVSASRTSMHKAISGTHLVSRSNSTIAQNISVMNISNGAHTFHRASSSGVASNASGASLVAIAASFSSGTVQGYHRGLLTLRVHDFFLCIVVLVCSGGSALACWSLSQGSEDLCGRDSGVEHGECVSKQSILRVGRARNGALAGAAASTITPPEEALTAGPCLAATSRDWETCKAQNIIPHDLDCPRDSMQSLDSIQLRPRIAEQEQSSFRRDPSVPALSFGFKKAAPRLCTPQISPRISQHYYSPRLSVRNLPPPLYPDLVLPPCEACFAVPLHTLAQIDVGQFNVVGPSGSALLSVVLRRGSRGKFLELSLVHAPNSPHAVVGPPSQRGLQICGPGGVYYGMLEPQASGAYSVTRGAQNHQVMCIDVAGRQLTVNTADGHSLAFASINIFSGVEHLELKVHNGVDSILVISSVLAIFLLGACTPGNPLSPSPSLQRL